MGSAVVRFGRGFQRALMREVGRMLRRPVLVIFGVFVPISLLIFMFYLYDAGVPRDLPVAVCDQDRTSLSRQVTRAVDATPSVRIAAAVMNPAEGKRLLERREVYALLVIPNDCEKSTLRGLAPAVVLYYNNMYIMAGSVIYRDIREALAAISSGLAAASLEKAGIMSGQARQMTAAITVVQHRLFNPYTNYQYYLSAGFMPTVLQMFILLTSILAMGLELKDGTAGEWREAAGGNTGAALMGKLCPYTVCFFVEGIFMVTMLVRYGGVPLQGHLSVILAGLFVYILAYQAVAVAIVALLANLRFAMTVGASYASIAFTFCGLTFPAMAMPLAVRYIGDTIPLTHYLRIFISQSLRGAPLSSDILSFGALLLFLALPLLVRPRWHRLLREERYWGGI